MVSRKLVALGVATLFGAALMVAPAQARFGEVPGHRFAFFPHGRFVPPFFPISAFYAYGPSYPSCWTRLPTNFGWRRVWVCNWPYGLGYDYY